MPLDAFIDKVMALFGETPTPSEILVERVKPLRRAEADGAFADRLTMLTTAATQT
jgi:uncharacterized oxidoreductase